MLNNYDCYFIALPNATNIHKNNDSELRSSVEKAKGDLTKLDTWSDASLDYFRDTLNRLPSDSSGMNTNLVGQLRSKLDASQLARADEVCEFSD